MAFHRFLVDRGDRELLALDSGLDGVGGGLVFDVEALERFAADGLQAGADLLGFGGQESGLDGPVFVGLEGFDFGLAVADQAERYGLNAAGGAGAGQLAPQHRRQVEADQVVERAAGEVGVNQRPVDLARFLHRLEDRLLGDRVEGHTLDDHTLLDEFLIVQHLEDVPGDGLAFPIGVGCENEFFGALHSGGDLFHRLFGVIYLPVHDEVVVGLDRAILGGKVANVTERRDHFKVRPQVLVDGFGFGRRFDNHNVHRCLSRSTGRSGYRTACISRY